MKKNIIIMAVFAGLMSFTTTNAQINLGDKALGAIQNGVASLTFSDADAALIASKAAKKMDSTHVVAGPKDGYALRLNRIFGKHSSENGLALNYKVYLTKDINAFAMADGTVRVFSGLMDVMDDNQLLAVIGHEIGHVANHDSRDAVKAAYRKAAVIGAVSSQSSKVAAVTDGQVGQIGNALLDSRYSRKQETDADTYSYDFMKRNGYNVNAVESAFAILAKMSQGNGADIISQMMSSHPDPSVRAERAKAKAEADGLYKPYTQMAINNKVPVVKKSTKKTATKKKKK